MRPVAIFNIEIIQVFREDCHVGDAEGEVYIDIVRDVFLGARYDMQLSMLGQPEPHMLAVMERLWYSFEFHDVLIEVRGAVQVRYIDGLVAEARSLRMGRKGHQERRQSASDIQSARQCRIMTESIGS